MPFWIGITTPILFLVLFFTGVCAYSEGKLKALASIGKALAQAGGEEKGFGIIDETLARAGAMETPA